MRYLVAVITTLFFIISAFAQMKASATSNAVMYLNLCKDWSHLSHKLERSNPSEEAHQNKTTEILDSLKHTPIIYSPLMNSTIKLDSLEEEEILCYYNPPELKSSIISGYLMKVWARFHSGDRHDWLVFRIEMYRSPWAESYGKIPRFSRIGLYTLDGNRIDLESIRESLPTALGTEFLSYVIQCPVYRKEKNQLSSTLLDKISVRWETGDEDYPVQNIALIRNQIKNQSQ